MADAGASKSDAGASGSSRKRRKKNPPPQNAGANAGTAEALPNVVDLQMKLHRRHVDRTVAHLWGAADAAGASDKGLFVSRFTGTNDMGIELYWNGLLLSDRGETKWVAIDVDDMPKWKTYLVSNGYEEWSDIVFKNRINKQAAMNYLLRCKVLKSDESNAAAECKAVLNNNNTGTTKSEWYNAVYDYFKDVSF